MKRSLFASALLSVVLSTAGGAVHAKESVVVAVVDSGVLTDHPSLQGKLLAGMDMVSGPYSQRGGRSANVAPDERNARCEGRDPVAQHRTHGTEVASVIVGNGNGGAWGVAPQAKVVPVRVMSACGMSRQDLLDALAWSAGMQVAGLPVNPNPARIINVSLAGGGSHCGQDLQRMVNLLNDKGVFVVAAAGNTFGQRLKEPANCQGVISVGAVDRNNQVANYSALDERTVVYAQGGTISRVTNKPGDRIATFNLSAAGFEVAQVENRRVGTSYAAPLVSGFIANQLASGESHRDVVIKGLIAASVAITTPDSCKDCEPRRLVDVTTHSK
jgi:serine protease